MQALALLKTSVPGPSPQKGTFFNRAQALDRSRLHAVSCFIGHFRPSLLPGGFGTAGFFRQPHREARKRLSRRFNV